MRCTKTRLESVFQCLQKNPVNEMGESLFAMEIVLWDLPNINRLVREDLRLETNLGREKDGDQCLHEKEESFFAMNHVLQNVQNIDRVIQTFQR